MAGALTERQRAAAKKKRRELNKQTWADLMQMAQAYDLPRWVGVSVADVLQEALERVYLSMRLAGMEADKLTETEFWEYNPRSGQLEPNRWTRLEVAMRDEATSLAIEMERLGIAERQVLAAEKIAGMIAPILEGIVQDLKLTPEQQSLLRPALARRLPELEAAA